MTDGVFAAQSLQMQGDVEALWDRFQDESGEDAETSASQAFEKLGQLDELWQRGDESGQVVDVSIKQALQTLEQLWREFEKCWREDLKKWELMFTQARYGCWCGPGHICEGEQDAMDTCCHHHDLAYDALGIGQIPGQKHNSMWSVGAFKKTLDADRTLVECVKASDPPEEEGKVYRELLFVVMEGRIRVAEWLIAHGL